LLTQPRQHQQQWLENTGGHLNIDEGNIVDGGETLHELAPGAVLCGDEIADDGAWRLQLEEVPDGDRDAAPGGALIRSCPIRSFSKCCETQTLP